jgi:hypothetical protein
VVAAVRLPVDWVPLVALVPDQPPDAVQVEALVVLQERVAEEPLTTLVGLADRVTVGSPGAVTVTVTVSAVFPPGPLQVRIYVVVAVRFPVAWLPLVGLVPLQPPEAAQLVALVVVQLRVEDAPLTSDVGFAARVTTGTGSTVTVADWLAEPPGPVQARV